LGTWYLPLSSIPWGSGSQSGYQALGLLVQKFGMLFQNQKRQLTKRTGDWPLARTVTGPKTQLIKVPVLILFFS
jgi:hypothetical protein